MQILFTFCLDNFLNHISNRKQLDTHTFDYDEISSSMGKAYIA